ncbi:MAG: hypothetical protein ISR76_06580 [Planctomycetes bacterium]|nr:hypothetical protein [Planctomycetota bacterium]MBL7008646.1 hypothetical protein [Planctomycetota bacterium]
MAEDLPARFSQEQGRLPLGVAEGLRRALRDGRRVKDEAETLLVFDRSAEPGLWWKLYRVPPRRRVFAWLGRSRALREWRALRCIQAAGLPVVPALACAEDRRGGLLRSSLLVTGDLPGARDLRRLWLDPAIGRDRRLELAAAAGGAAARLHGAGFGHFRMQLRNLLLLPDGDIAWLDAPYACRWPGPSPRRIRSLDLVDLSGADSLLSVEETERCLLAYAAEAGWAPPLSTVRGRGRLPQKLRRIASYLMAVNLGRRIPPVP